MTDKNIVQINPGWGWAQNSSYAQGIRANGLIYVSGQLALDSEGKLVGEGSLEEQSRQIFRNLDEILRAGGSSLDRIVRLTCYCLDFDDYAAFGRVRKEIFKNGFPASTAVAVAGLLIPGALLEVDAIALE